MSAAGRAWAAMLAVCAGVVVADQATKELVIAAIDPGERVDLALGVDLTHVTNSGIAFGLLDESGAAVPVITAAALVAVLGWFAFDAERPGMWLGVGLLVGGALGNLADRARADAVTDFIDLPLWPAFNLADVAITLGVAVLVLSALAGAREDPGAAAP